MREEAVKEEELSLPRGRIQLVNMAGRYSFSDGEGSARNARSAMPSDVSSVDEHHKYHPVLEPTPPSPTQPLVLAMPSTRVMSASRSMMTMPVTPTKGGMMLMSRIGSVKKWGVRRWRGTSSTPSEVIGGFFSYYSFFFSQSFLIYCFFHQLNHYHQTPLTVLLVQEPPCHLLHVNYR